MRNVKRKTQEEAATSRSRVQLSPSAAGEQTLYL